jgi:hypothetical protein
MVEDRVRQLEIANAQLATSVQHLASSVETLTGTVQLLRDTMNQGRGMAWLLMTLSGGFGATLAFVVQYLMGRHS